MQSPALAAATAGVPLLAPGCGACWGAPAVEFANDLSMAAFRISAAFVKLKLDDTDAPPTELMLGACGPQNAIRIITQYHACFFIRLETVDLQTAVVDFSTRY